MIVQRDTVYVKVGCMDQAIELIKAEMSKREGPPKWRILTPQFGVRTDMIVVEWEFESLAKLEEFWAVWLAKPETAEFWKRYNQLVETGGHNETWNLVSES